MDKITEYFALQKTFAQEFRRYSERGVIRTMDSRAKEYNFQSPSAEQHYFRVGANALRICVAALGRTLRPCRDQ